MSQLKNFFLLFVVSVLFSSCSSKDNKLNMPGERVKFFISNVIGPQLSSESVMLPDVHDNAQWSGGFNQFENDASNLQLMKKDDYSKFSYSNNTKMQNISMPAVDGDVIYLPTSKGEVIAYDFIKKDVVWKNDYFEQLESVSFAEIFSNKFLAGAVTIYGDKLIVTFGLSKVVALNKNDGSVIWEASVGYPVRSFAAVSQDVLIMQSIDDHIFAIDASDGSLKWDQSIGFANVANMSIASIKIIDGDKAIAHSADDVIFCFDINTGNELWYNDLLDKSSKRSYMNFTQTISGPEAVFIAGNKAITIDGLGSLVAIDTENSAILWDIKMLGADKMWVCGNSVFVLTNGNEINAININDGLQFWGLQLDKIDKNGNKISFTNPIIANNVLYIASSDGKLLLIDAISGKISSVEQVPAVNYVNLLASGGNILATSNDGVLLVK